MGETLWFNDNTLPSNVVFFTLDQKDYLVVVDYYSGYWELGRLHSTDAGAIIKKFIIRVMLPDMAVAAN